MTTTPPLDSHWIRTCPDEAFRQAVRREAHPAAQALLFRERARDRPAFFALQALGHCARLPFAPYHHTLFAWHGRMGAEPLAARAGLRFALAAPRGTAKSTVVSFILLLHDIAYARERYVLLVSATQRQAQQRLAAIRRELAARTRLNAWFSPAFDRRRMVNTARVLEANGVRVEAFGAGAEMRGVSHDGWRPTKIVLDDAESSAVVASPRRRARLHDWFSEVVEHLGGGHTHFLAIGTVLHREGLLETLLARPDFTAMRCRSIESFATGAAEDWRTWRRILTTAPAPENPAGQDARQRARAFFLQRRRAMESGSRVLWPEHEDYEELMAQLVLQGRRAFYQEKQNQPLGREDALFRMDAVRRARREPGGAWTLEGGASAAPSSWRAFGFLDPALGGKSRAGDYAALATVLLADDGLLLLSDCWVRRAPPTEQIRRLFDLHERVGYELLAVEGTGFQDLMRLPVEDERRRRAALGRALSPPVRYVQPRRRKETRIAALEPLLSSGRLVLAEDLDEEFWRELESYPNTAHDDALDAAAGAVELALGRVRTPRPAAPPRPAPRNRPDNAF